MLALIPDVPAYFRYTTMYTPFHTNTDALTYAPRIRPRVASCAMGEGMRAGRHGDVCVPVFAQDKAKIEAVIDELAQKKIDALQKTWEKACSPGPSLRPNAARARGTRARCFL
eukprot:6171977-Pleurochrysis_carterae.AAC.2